MKKAYLEILECKRHGFRCIALSDDNGGLRLTGGKCCGSWETVKKWEMSEDDLVAMRGRINHLLRQVRRG